MNSSPPQRATHVGGAHGVAQAGGDLAQHGVPDLVPVGVVDRLEVIDVDEQQARA